MSHAVGRVSQATVTEVIWPMKLNVSVDPEAVFEPAASK